MMRSSHVAATLFILLPLGGRAQDHIHQHAKPVSTAPITITINPESRVSVVLSGSLPAPAQCGTLTTLPLKVINQSFATIQLEASLVGDTPTPDTSINFHPEPLKGIPEELRNLSITLSQPGPVDITLSFGARHVAHDLGGRDRIHFMMRCVPPT